jgi:hypothetical protein
MKKEIDTNSTAADQKKVYIVVQGVDISQARYKKEDTGHEGNRICLSRTQCS